MTPSTTRLEGVPYEYYKKKEKRKFHLNNDHDKRLYRIHRYEMHMMKPRELPIIERFPPFTCQTCNTEKNIKPWTCESGHVICDECLQGNNADCKICYEVNEEG